MRGRLSGQVTSVLAGVLLALLVLGRAAAADPPPAYRSSWFLDLGAGIGVARATSLLYNDPLGVPFTNSPVSGGNVILSNLANTHKSVVAAASFGRFLTDDFYIRGSYRNFGRSAASGFGAFGPANFQQIQATTADAGFIGLGFTYDLAEGFYFDASGELGAAFVRSGGVHDANLFPQPFPKRKLTNLAGGVGLGLGYAINRNLDLMLTVGYDYLGKSLTGTTCHCTRPDAPPGLSEYLSSKLRIIPILFGLRARM